MSKIITITNPVDLILAQLAEIREGNARMRERIKEAHAALRGAAKEEARLEAQLAKILSKQKGNK